MKNRLYVILACALLMASCQKESPESGKGTAATKMSSVTLTFAAPGMETATRALTPEQEKAVGDVNLWLCHRTNPEVSEHLFLTSGGNVPLRLVGGDYDYYAIANAGKDLGDMQGGDLAAYRAALGSQDDVERGECLLMSAHGSFTAAEAATIPVRLVRCAAKIELSLSVASEFAPNITLQSVQVMNVPGTVSCFAENRPADVAAFFEYAPHPVSGNTFAGSFYVPENLAGENSAITDPRHKGWQLAPQGALCIRVRATAGGNKVDYYLFAGENDTSDFNVGRNRRYGLSAVITGISSVDLRVAVTSLSATDWHVVYATGETAESYLQLSGSNIPTSYTTLSYQLLEGTGTVTIDGITQTPDRPLVVLPGGRAQYLTLGYSQCTEGAVRLLLTLRDSEGYVIEKELTTRFEASMTLACSAPPTSVNGQAVPFTLSIEKTCYNGGFHVQFVTDGDPCTFSLEGVVGTEFYLPDGSKRTYMVAPPPQTRGNKIYHITVGTYPGDPKSKTILGAVRGDYQPKTITVTLTPTITFSQRQLAQGVYVGMQKNPLQLNLKAESSEPVETPLRITALLRYTEEYCSTVTVCQDTPTSRTATVTLNAGAQSATTTAASYTGFCIGVDPAHPYRRSILLSAGYYFGPMVSFVAQEQITAELTGTSASQNTTGTVFYTYKLINP